jgi:hypothetical protein
MKTKQLKPGTGKLETQDVYLLNLTILERM